MKEEYQIIIDKQIAAKIDKNTSKDRILLQRVRKTFQTLKTHPYYPGLKTHKVRSKAKNPALASWVDSDFRIIWEFSQHGAISILDFGTHKEVYL